MVIPLVLGTRDSRFESEQIDFLFLDGEMVSRSPLEGKFLVRVQVEEFIWKGVRVAEGDSLENY